MKKLICLAIALVLCIGSVAMAEFVPSKSTADMAAANEVKTETGVAVADDFKVEPVSDSVATQEQAEQCAQMIGEISAAMTTGSVVDYFGDLQDNSGETVSLEEILGTDKPVVNEIMPLSVQNYDPSYGAVTTSFTFSTPYEKDEPVVVVIRVVDPKTGKVTQIALKGKGTGVNGGIEVEFPPEVMEAIQNGTATMAVVSK